MPTSFIHSRLAFSDRTNTSPASSPPQTPTRHPVDSRGKRPADENEDVRKRIKLEEKAVKHDTLANETGDVEMKEVDARPPATFRGLGFYGVLQSRRMGLPSASRRPIPAPSTAMLETFVSSHKTDIYRCHSLDANTFLTPPYACSFTNASKAGRSSILVVATELGNIDIIDTKRREENDPEPCRSIIQVHDNGIFDVKWSRDDSLVATASGDHSIRITDPKSNLAGPSTILRGHSSTAKCVIWDPSHQDLLASAGRDGCICLWDLRMRNLQNSDDTEDNGSKALVMKIPYAHEPVAGKPSKKGRTVLAPRSVTSIVYGNSSYELVSSGSSDGYLRKWDIRCASQSPSLSPTKKTKKPAAIIPIDFAHDDLTTVPSSMPTIAQTYSPRRSRGISSLALGSGISAGQLFALGNDSRIHTYNPSGAAGLPIGVAQRNGPIFSHRHMSTNSFYVRIGVSPCGRWLASGGSSGSAFVFDVSQQSTGTVSGVELKGQEGEVGALDWANGSLATCADDGTVRIWRPDLERHRLCLEDTQQASESWSWGRL